MIGSGKTGRLRGLRTRLGRWAGQPGSEDWQSRFRAMAARDGVGPVLRRHIHAKRLDEGFSVGAYLARNPDVADAVDSAGEAVFHYLEFGHAEGRVAQPDQWSPWFVARHHGLVLPETYTPHRALLALRAHGLGAEEALLCEADIWAIRGVHGAVFSRIFEHEFYAVAAEAAGHPLAATDRLSAIAHFCELGLAKGIPPHPDHAFDDIFYRDALAEAGMPLPGSAHSEGLRRHWARIGVRAGAHANPHAWFVMRYDVALPEAILAALPTFREASADLDNGASIPATLSHLASVPFPGAEVFDLAAPGVQTFMLDLARHLRRAGDPGASEWALRRVLSSHPHHSRASVDLADLIHGQNRIGTEIQLRQAVPMDFDSGANQITLAERLIAQNRLREALDICSALPGTVQSDVALRRRRRHIGATVFSTIWSDLATQIATTPVPDIQAILAKALEIYTPPFTAPSRAGAIERVAVFVNDDLFQCKLYRADQKIDQLRRAGYSADLFLQGIDTERLRSRLDLYDAVIFVRVPAFLDIIDLIADAAQQGLATFFDCDDLIFDPGVFPPPLETYGGQITATEHAAIACGVPLFRQAMSLCDYGLASTPIIKDAMKPVVRSGRVFLHRNALGAPHLQARANSDRIRKPGTDKVVVFYGSGTKAHKGDFVELLEPALAEVLARRPGKVEVRLIGDFAEFGHLDPRHRDLRLISPVWDFEAFCAEVAAADINLSVLKPSRLTDAKSEIKWMEAAMFGIPSVVSPTACHRDVIEEGLNGLTARSPEEFTAAILKLVDDAELRQRIGAAARRQVMADYGLDAMGQNISAILSEVRPVDARGKARLLIVNVFYPPQDIGGATRVVQDNVADLLRLYGDRYEIDVVATLEGGERPYEVSCHARDGARIWTVTARGGIDTMDYRDHRMGDVFDRLVSRIQPDIVHLHCIQRLTASIVDVLRRREMPYVVTLHDGWWVSPNQFIAAADGALDTYDFRPEAAVALPERARVTRRSLDGAAALLAVSDRFAELHRKAGIEGVEVVENGIAALPARQALPAPAGRVRLGLIGGATRHKGYSLLRAAIHAQRFKNLDLVVIDHAMAPGMQREDVWNGTPVLFLPRCPLSEVGALYGRLDVLLAPSIWPESYGLVTREALALGLWVVASDRGAIGQDVTEGKNGFVVDVSDHHGLQTALAQIDATPDRYRRAPEHRPALRTSEEQADALHAVYQRILQQGAEDGSD